MGVTLNPKGIISWDLDLESEVIKPKNEGYYLEAIAKLDAIIDSQLDAFVRLIYPDEGQDLLNAMEKSMRREYLFVSGLVKLKIIQESERAHRRRMVLPEELATKIRWFKEKRNKALHSELGYYNLVENRNKTNDAFQEEAKNEAVKTIEEGIGCLNQLIGVLTKNIPEN